MGKCQKCKSDTAVELKVTTRTGKLVVGMFCIMCALVILEDKPERKGK